MSTEKLKNEVQLPDVNFKKQILECWNNLIKKNISKGELDLDVLLKNINPVLDSERIFVFATTTEEMAEGYFKKAKMIFREKEGVTLILDKNDISPNEIKNFKSIEFECRQVLFLFSSYIFFYHFFYLITYFSDNIEYSFIP